MSNPPFHRISSGRINPDSQRAIARHELKVTLEDVLKAAGRMLRTAGKFVCIYGSDRLVDLFAQMRTCHIEPKFMRLIQSKAGTDARLVLVEGVKRGNRRADCRGRPCSSIAMTETTPMRCSGCSLRNRDAASRHAARVSILDKPGINIIMEPEHNRGTGFAACGEIGSDAFAAYPCG